MTLRRISYSRFALSATLAVLFCTVAQAQTLPLTSGPALPLYRALRNVGLDPQRVYKIREAAIDRDDIHLWLNDGTIAFTQSVDGRITGAYFEGEGEVLVRPPDRRERASLGLFTQPGSSGNAILLGLSAFQRRYRERVATISPSRGGWAGIRRAQQCAGAAARIDGRDAVDDCVHQRQAYSRRGRVVGGARSSVACQSV